MVKFSSGRGGGGGGGGRSFGPVQNTFGDAATADRAAAEALRDAYAGANAAWLALYDGNRAFLILLQWTGDGEVAQRRNVAGDNWEDVTDVVTGPRGAMGDSAALKLIVGGRGVTGPNLDGDHAIGDTVLTLLATADQMATMSVGDRALIGDEFHRLTAIDEINLQVTIGAPGLVAAKSSSTFSTGVMYGVDDVLQLPGGPYDNLDVRLTWESRFLNGNRAQQTGRSVGTYASPRGSWYETLNSPNYQWFAGGDIEQGLATYGVAILHTGAGFADAWELGFDPVASTLAFRVLPSNAADTRTPRISALFVSGS